MKKKINFLILFLLISYYPSWQVNYSNLVQKNDLLYEKNKEKPFKGVAITYHENGKKRYIFGLKEGKKA